MICQIDYELFERQVQLTQWSQYLDCCSDVGILRGCCLDLELIKRNESCLEQGTRCDKTFLREIHLLKITLG